MFGRSNKIAEDFGRKPKACRRILDVIAHLAAVGGNGAALGSVVTAGPMALGANARPNLVMDDGETKGGCRSGGKARCGAVIKVVIGRRADENQAGIERTEGRAQAKQRGGAGGIAVASAVMTQTRAGGAKAGNGAAQLGPADGGKGGGGPTQRARVRGAAIGQGDDSDAHAAAGGGSDKGATAEGFVVGMRGDDHDAARAGPAQDRSGSNVAERWGMSRVWHGCAMLRSPLVFPRPILSKRWLIESGRAPRLSMPLPSFRLPMWQTSVPAAG